MQCFIKVKGSFVYHRNVSNANHNDINRKNGHVIIGLHGLVHICDLIVLLYFYIFCLYTIAFSVYYFVIICIRFHAHRRNSGKFSGQNHPK